jgi:hypothetical protein
MTCSVASSWLWGRDDLARDCTQSAFLKDPPSSLAVAKPPACSSLSSSVWMRSATCRVAVWQNWPCAHWPQLTATMPTLIRPGRERSPGWPAVPVAAELRKRKSGAPAADPFVGLCTAWIGLAAPVQQSPRARLPAIGAVRPMTAIPAVPSSVRFEHVAPER